MEKARPRRPNNRPVPRQRSSPLQLPSPLSSRVIMGQRPTYEDENGFYSATSLPEKAPPSPLSSRPERSGAERSLC
jgi:hypothetical protein